MELTNEFDRGMTISHSSEADESKLPDDDMLSLTSSDLAATTLLTSSHE